MHQQQPLTIDCILFFILANIIANVQKYQSDIDLMKG